jgi:hypothetical protein
MKLLVLMYTIIYHICLYSALKLIKHLIGKKKKKKNIGLLEVFDGNDLAQLSHALELAL